MEPLRQLGLGLCLLACIPAYAHDPLPINWGTQTNSLLAEIGVFEIEVTELLDALADEEALASQCATEDSSYAPTAVGGNSGEDAYWEYAQPLNSCGVVLRHLDWNAATRLARRKCAELSAAQNIWPPAIPFVTAPATYNDLNALHHDLYRVTHGKLIGTCIAESLSAPTSR